MTFGIFSLGMWRSEEMAQIPWKEAFGNVRFSISMTSTLRFFVLHIFIASLERSTQITFNPLFWRYAACSPVPDPRSSISFPGRRFVNSSIRSFMLTIAFL